MTDFKECFICGRNRHAGLERHHQNIFNGANRKLSEQDGLVVYLCHDCHNEPPLGVHYNAEMMRWLKQKGQKMAMEKYGWTKEEFVQRYGKNYLDD